MNKSVSRIYWLICFLFVIALAGVRTSPVYGKLDFLLLDGRPWWPAWQSMIEYVVITDEKKPFFSDTITSTVVRAVFARPSLFFRFDPRYSLFDIDAMDEWNEPTKISVPGGALSLLLSHDDNGEFWLDSGDSWWRYRENSSPYICVVNLQGFSPSWVGEETGHWSVKWADTSYWYKKNGVRGKGIKEIVEQNPPEFCKVYF